MRRIGIACWGLLIPLAAGAQQRSDDTFHFEIATPAFRTGAGPTVCIDEGHHNFHTAGGRYEPFATILRDDGYVVTEFSGSFDANGLAECELLVIANPLAAENQTDWTYPHPSAFSKAEIQQVTEWTRSGGRLLVFADHAPIAGATRDLAATFGVLMIDAYVDGGAGPDVFKTTNGSLRPHAIVRGRSESESVDSIVTFTGQAFQLTEGWLPLVVFGPNAVARFSLPQGFQQGPPNEWPSFSVGGWAHAGVREWDRGRVVFVGEAAMCSAQVSGEERFPMGMNVPGAEQNGQFCLNVVRWLTGALDSP